MKVLALVGVLLLSGCGFEVVDTGRRGLKVRFGEVVSKPLPEGIYFYNPFTSDIKEVSVQEEKLEDVTQAFTRDTQNVNITYAVTYYPNPDMVDYIYKQFGYQWDSKIIKPAVLGSIKDVVGQYIADDLVGKREMAKAAAQKELVESLAQRNIIVTRLDFVNLDFDDAYEKAVEEKVVAVQGASKAKNETVRIQEEAKQKIETAKAEAEAMRIKTQALSQNKGLVDYEAVQRWDGKLPQYMFGNSIPMLNLKGLGQ